MQVGRGRGVEAAKFLGLFPGEHGVGPGFVGLEGELELGDGGHVGVVCAGAGGTGVGDLGIGGQRAGRGKGGFGMRCGARVRAWKRARRKLVRDGFIAGCSDPDAEGSETINYRARVDHDLFALEAYHCFRLATKVHS